MKRLIAIGLTMSALFFSATTKAAEPEEKFKGTFVNKEYRINLVIDLSAETVEVPGLSFLGKTHGYMGGNIYGVWMITSRKLKGNEATIRISNDQGADSQTVRLTPTAEGGLDYEVIGENEVKHIEGRKLVKVPSKLHFDRK